MGFNKRFINQDVLKTLIQEGDIEKIIDYIKKPDALVITDNFSKKVCDAVLNNQMDVLIEIINGEKKR